ncbi:MAG: sulfatase-like hydrolase/transferase [Gammaproteobacteria bacterium]|nr:sulfatase-like hydrolase/transferase [Gammaproteobacteria bacterium]
MKPIRLFLLTLLTALLNSFAHANDQPNIVIMVADDIGWADVGYHGGQIDTPSIDRIANEGAQLDRFYTTPICSPTRAALMTGRDPMRLGIAYSVVMPWTNLGVHPDEHFMPQSFQAAGYQTALVGKWHLGHAQETYHPNQRGFEHFYGHLHTETGYFPPFGVQGGKDFQINGETIEPEGYESFLLGDEASRWIEERDKNKPFFLYMPFIAPHTPLEAPQDLIDKYSDIEFEREPSRSASDETYKFSKILGVTNVRTMFSAVVDGMDQAMGKVLDTLDREGLTENTIVMFFSDNGGAVYSVGGAYNAPLRGGKGETFEGGIRVVSALRWPAKIPAGSKIDSIISIMDVFPTLSALAGVEPLNRRKLDGRNMAPAVVENQYIPLRKNLMFGSETPIKGQFSLTAFNEEWKLVQEIKQGFLSADVTNYLFNIKEDPNEWNNLASEHPRLVASLSKAIRDWRMLYPVNGTRSNLVPPPGWRAPLDWAKSMRKLDELNTVPARGMPPEFAKRPLDMMHGEGGRIIYDCEPKWWLAGWCLKND